jgi:hypothetical protein
VGKTACTAGPSVLISSACGQLVASPGLSRSLLVRGLGAQDRGEQPVHLQSGGLDVGQPVLAQQPGQLDERQRIPIRTQCC